MPIATITKILRPEDAVEYIADLIDDSTIPVAYVAKYMEPLRPEYPAVQVVAGNFQKEIHGAGGPTLLLTLRADIYVMHAKLTVDHATRSLEDMQLATQIVQLIEGEMDDFGPLKLGGRIIAGWVEHETPGVSPPRIALSEAVVSTRLSWRGTQEVRSR